MRHLAEGGAICLLFALALMADGLVERVGLGGFAVIGAAILCTAAVLIEWGGPKKKPPTGGSSSSRRRHRRKRKRQYITAPL